MWLGSQRHRRPIGVCNITWMMVEQPVMAIPSVVDAESSKPLTEWSDSKFQDELPQQGELCVALIHT